MRHDQLINLIIDRLRACPDDSLLDLILKLLIESGY
jgi:hypothetical protein